MAAALDVLLFLSGALVVFLVVLDGFETVVVPRRVTMPFQIARFFYTSTWKPWVGLARHIGSKRRRENFLSFYGPSSLILLLAIWGAGVIFGFGVMYWSLGGALVAQHGNTHVSFPAGLYYSASTFFTLGLGDIQPAERPLPRLLTVLESGTGFGLLAMVIGFLPVLYQAFSNRERNISLLDARAGSPPTAVEMLRRYSRTGSIQQLNELLRDWEDWSAELLETQLSYPVLAYFRSQHTAQSWLGSIKMILDTCSLILAAATDARSWQTELTYAMARHAVVDLAQVLRVPPSSMKMQPMTAEDLDAIGNALAGAGLAIRNDGPSLEKLNQLRSLYEPYAQALAAYLNIQLPPWRAETPRPDDWRTSAYERPTGIQL